MTPDSLEVAQRAVLLTECRCFPEVVVCRTEHPPRPDYPAIAAATREWMRQQLPPPEGTHEPEYNRAIADVARWLGLEP